MAYSAGPPSVADLATLAGLVSTAYLNHLASLLSQAYGVNSITCADLANPSKPLGLDNQVVAGTRPGTYPSATLPANACATLIFHPDRKYRGSKPKSFQPWGVDTDLGTNSVWLNSFVSEVQQSWNGFIAALEGKAFGSSDLGGQVAVSYIEPPYTNVPIGSAGRVRREGTPRNPPLVQHVVSVTCQDVIGSQRRRLG